MLLDLTENVRFYLKLITQFLEFFESPLFPIRDRSKMTSHNLYAKVQKALDILHTECELILSRPLVP